MLRLHFINVGDGDAILAEEEHGGDTFRLLADAGRADAGSHPGSRRLTAAAYLARRNIRRLDAVVVTHLHSDHFEGLAAVLETAEVGAVYAGFFPPPCAGGMPRTGAEEKTVRGLKDCLERWTAVTAALRARAVPLLSVEETASLPPTPRLSIQIICGDPGAAARQRRVWTALLSGEAADPDMVWWSSKFRNPGSLRLRLTYGGRRIELAGDCYGAAWEDQAEPCAILKVPHHGDAKSLTPLLVRRLRPEHAVISCSAEYVARKDRPSLAAIRLLEEQGARVWFTDSFPQPGREPSCWSSADFTIREDGVILPPDRG